MGMRSVILFAIILLLQACTPLEKIYRDNLANSASGYCSMPAGDRLVTLDDEYYVRKNAISASNMSLGGIECNYQRVPIQENYLFDDINKTFDLAFVEFSGKSGAVMDGRQLENVIDAISNNEKVYVITYIMRWRHNADIANNDVRRFKTLLAYARHFLNQRGGTYSDHRLIGVFMGWRGQVFDEAELPAGKKSSLLELAGAAATLKISENTSEKVAPFIYDALKKFDDALDSKTTGNQNKHLIVGHSMGGNVLATILNDCSNGSAGRHSCYSEAVKSHDAGSELEPILGDLVVIVNPAAAAYKWINIQRAVDARQTDGNRIFPDRQKPVYMAFTATANWGSDETADGKKKTAPDDATRIFYPLYKSATLNYGRESTVAIGHYFPKRGNHYGTSHDFITNDGSKVKTEVAALANPANARCDVNNGWLSKTRENSRRSTNPVSWDTGYRKNGLAYAYRDKKSVTYQFRSAQYFAFSPGKKIGNVEIAHEPYFNIPFWNIRAFESVINGHSGYVNYPFWCAVNQIVLDDIVAKH